MLACPAVTDPSALQLVFLAGAALLAGAINAIAGGGSLISFPALLAVGYSPVAANVTNQVGLVPGYLGGSVGYRAELTGGASPLQLWVSTTAPHQLLKVALVGQPVEFLRVP